jgi:hypothetical protein
MARGMVSKFQPCLPESAEDRLLAEKLLDLEGTLRFLGTVELRGVRATARPTATRLVDGEASKPLALELRFPEAPAGTATPKNEVQWVDTPAALRAVSAELQAAEVVALDVETALDFGTLYLVQIATRQRTYIIDPFAVGDLTPLAAVLNAPKPRKVIHNARFERRVLGRVGIPLQGVYDTHGGLPPRPRRQSPRRPQPRHGQRARARPLARQVRPDQLRLEPPPPRRRPAPSSTPPSTPRSYREQDRQSAMPFLQCHPPVLRGTEYRHLIQTEISCPHFSLSRRC